MNRFKRSKLNIPLKALILPLLSFVLIFGIFYVGISQINETATTQQYENLKTAIRQSIVHCYAVEGRYPESLAYIEDHYGLTYDTSKYYIDYQPVAANLMPDVTIILLEANQ